MTKQIFAMLIMGLLGGMVLLYGLIHAGVFFSENFGARVAVEART